MVVFCLFGSLISTLQLSPLVGADGEFWLPGYSNRQKLTITGSSGAGTNYQIFLRIHEGSGGASSGENCYLDGNCQNYPYDIAFTDNDGKTKLDFFIENLTASPIRTWIEVADDLNTTKSIYIYYNKLGITTSDSNGTATFDFFYDFRTTYDPANLTQDANTGDKWIYLYNVSAFDVGDTVSICDRSHNGSAPSNPTYWGTRGSSENITIESIHANNSIKITSGLTREFNVSHYATVSHWFRHRTYDDSGFKTLRWYNELNPISMDRMRTLQCIELSHFDAVDPGGGQATVGIGIDKKILLDEEYDEISDVAFIRYHNKKNYNATNTNLGIDLYSVNDGVEDTEGGDELVISISPEDDPAFSEGDEMITELLVDNATVSESEFMLSNFYISDTLDYSLNHTDESWNPDFGVISDAYANELNYFFLRVHGGVPCSYKFRYNTTNDALLINNTNPSGKSTELLVYWVAVSKFISPEPKPNSWGDEEETEEISFYSISGWGNVSIVPSQTPLFNWSKIINTIRYQLQIANDSAFTDIWRNLTNINETAYPSEYDEKGDFVEFTLPAAYQLDVDKQYYCRVRAYYYY